MEAYAKLALSVDVTDLEVDDEILSLIPSRSLGQHGSLNTSALSGYAEPTEEVKMREFHDDLPIYQAALPNGKRVPLLKTLLTSVCEKNCYYCFSRAGRDCPRHTFKPEELARVYMQIHQAGIARGIFLSSGVFGGGVRTQDRLLAAAEILRKNYRYEGYLHLKIMPGAERAQVERAMQLADRVSVNLEAPTSKRLAMLAPQKTMIEELIAPLKWVNEIRANDPGERGWKGRWPSSTTQFVVGAGDETDLEFLRASEYLYNRLNLARIYYSGFKPIQGTPLENKPAVNVWRRYRLYQASFLLKSYLFTLEDLPLDELENLPLDVDPKMAWARMHLAQAPMEINRARLHELIKIPGIGPRGAREILTLRKTGLIREIGQLKSTSIYLSRAAPFILLSGKRPPYQPVLL